MKNDKSKWMKIPTAIKEKLWRIMKSYPTPKSWEEEVDRTEFGEENKDYVRTSRYAFNRLRAELMETNVNDLPTDLREWAISLRHNPPESKPEIALPETTSDSKIKLKEHLKLVADTAKELAACIKTLRTERDELQRQNVFSFNNPGKLQFYWGSPDNMQMKEIDSEMARQVIIHYDENWDIAFRYWEDMTIEDATQQLHDNLVRLAYELINEDAVPAGGCPICETIAQG